jgi:hypothetical protein
VLHHLRVHALGAELLEIQDNIFIPLFTNKKYRSLDIGRFVHIHSKLISGE